MNLSDHLISSLSHVQEKRRASFFPMTIGQEMPKEFEKYPNKLTAYAKTFFGFGTWKADCWLIGIEEHGAATLDEFSRRYQAWKKLKSNEGLLDLSTFLDKAHLSFEPGNSTWKALNKICLCSCCQTDDLDDWPQIKPASDLHGWGRSNAGRKPRVALIEAMPFASPSTKDWPYKEWDFEFMKNREDCGSQFLPERSQIIADKFRQHKPKTVITYGSAFSYHPGLDIRGWISRVGNLPAARWEQFPIANGTKRKVTVFLKKVKWRSGKPSLIVFIPQPRYWGASVPADIGKQISVRQ